MELTWMEVEASVGKSVHRKFCPTQPHSNHYAVWLIQLCPKQNAKHPKILSTKEKMR